MKKFNEIFDDRTKYGTKLKTTEYQESGKYWIVDQGQDMIAGYSDKKEGSFEELPAIIFGDHTRTIKYINHPFFIGADGVKILRSRIEGANYKYLYYALKNVKIPNTGYNRHFKWLKDIKFNYPDKIVQEKIVQILDKVSTIIVLQKETLDSLDILVKARFIEMFGDMLLNTMAWNEQPLDSMANVVSGITKGRKTKDQHMTEVPYMAVSNVKDGYIDWSTIKTIEATEQEISQYRLLPNDVLMTEGGDPDKLGRGAIIKEPLENCIHQNHIFRVRLNESMILPGFFAEYLKHQKSKSYFLRCAKQTTGIASINMRQLKALPVLLPPLELQEQFAAFVAQTDKSKVAVQKALEEAQLLFDSLMQKYFG